MAVDWSTLNEAARSPDPNARAGAIIRAQAELERFMTAEGWQREDGESLYQLLVRARKTTNTAWISDDIGWAIKLRNAVAHEGAQPNNLDAQRAIQAYQDTAQKFGWAPDPDAAPKKKPARKRKKKEEPPPEEDVPDETEEAPKKAPAKKKPAKKKAPAKKKPAAKKKAAPRKKRPAKKKEEPRTGGARAMVAAVVFLGAVVFGISRLSRVTSAPTDAAALRTWVIPVRASASSAADSCRLDPSPERVPCAAGLAIDADPQTAWCEGAEGAGVGERLTVYLESPAVIESIRMKAGYQKDEERFTQNQAPTRLRVLAADRSHAGVIVPALETFSELRLPHPVQSDAITIVIEDTTPGQFAVTCVSELELQIQR